MTNIDVSFEELTELKLPDGVKRVNCSGNQLTELKLPDGVKLVYCSGNNFPEEEKQRIIKYCDDNDVRLVI